MARKRRIGYRRVNKSYYDYYYQKFWPMIHKIVNRFVQAKDNFDDYLDLANREFLYALSFFDCNKGSLSTWIYIYISGCIRRHQFYYEQRHNRFKTGLELKSFYCQDFESPIFIEEILNLLNPIERLVISSHYIKGLSLAKIAKSIHLDRSNVHYIKTKAIQKIKNRLSPLNNEANS